MKARLAIDDKGKLAIEVDGIDVTKNVEQVVIDVKSGVTRATVLLGVDELEMEMEGEVK